MIVYFAKGPMHGQVREMDYTPREFYVATPLVPMVFDANPNEIIPVKRGRYGLYGKDLYVYEGEEK